MLKKMYINLLLLIVVCSIFVTNHNVKSVSAAPVSIPVINTSNRAQVASSYITYLESTEPSLGLSGSDVASCLAGTISTANIDYTLTQVNWYRAMAGLSAVSNSSSQNTIAQASALFTMANQDFLSPSDPAAVCSSLNATAGVQNGSRALVNNASTSKKNITLLMDDYYYDPSTGVGNRYSLLSPKATTVGYGFIPPSGSYFWGGASYTWANALGSRSVDTTFGAFSVGGESLVAWPNKGYTPYKTTYSLWSVAGNGIDWTNANVSVVKAGVTCSPVVVFKGNLPSASVIESNLVWDMDQAGSCTIPLSAEFTHAKPAADTPYTVNITGAKNSVGTTLPTITYTTTVFNPGEAPTGLNVTPGYYSGSYSTGTVLSTLSGVDADPGATFTYSLVSGTGSTDNSMFSISGSNLLAGSSLTPGTKSIRIRVTDNLGLTYEKVVSFTIAPSGFVPVYRFFNVNNGSHFYTASAVERDNVIANISLVYRYEGIRFFVKPVVSNVCPSGSTALFRFFNFLNGSHFYTASAVERDNVIANISHVYRYEGIRMCISNSLTSEFNSPIFRFFNFNIGSHFYTASAVERDNVIANISHVYRYEGIRFYVFT